MSMQAANRSFDARKAPAPFEVRSGSVLLLSANGHFVTERAPVLGPPQSYLYLLPVPGSGFDSDGGVDCDCDLLEVRHGEPLYCRQRANR
jgi:hypothetical protein